MYMVLMLVFLALSSSSVLAQVSGSLATALSTQIIPGGSVEVKSAPIDISKDTDTVVVLIDVSKHTDPANCIDFTVYKNGGTVAAAHGICGKKDGFTNKSGKPITSISSIIFTPSGFAGELEIGLKSAQALETSAGVIMTNEAAGAAIRAAAIGNDAIVFMPQQGYGPGDYSCGPFKIPSDITKGTVLTKTKDKIRSNGKVIFSSYLSKNAVTFESSASFSLIDADGNLLPTKSFNLDQPGQAGRVFDCKVTIQGEKLNGTEISILLE